MIQSIFIILVCFCSQIFALPIQDRKIDPTALSELALELGIPKESDLIIETQKRWLRNQGLERWEMNELSLEQKRFVLKWAKDQGLYAPWEPILTKYDKGIILGCSTSLMKSRLQTLIDLWNEGVLIHEIVWLTGDRPLDPRVDGLIDRCKTESEAAHIIWQEANLPQEMKNLPVVFIEVPVKSDGKRPNTQDTVVAWLNTLKKPCSALFVSDQPFCGYQFAVIKSTLPNTIDFDVVGKGADPTSHPAAAAITLDSIACWIYQEHITEK